MKSLRGPRHRPAVDTSPELDTTDAELAELIAIWPRLEAALGVDAAGPSAGSSGGGGGGNAGRGSPSPVHLDTQAVIALIDVGVRKLEDQVIAATRMVTAREQLRVTRARIEAQQQRRAVAKASARRIARIQDTNRALTVDEHITALEAAYAYTQANTLIRQLHEHAAHVEEQHSTLSLLRSARDWYRVLEHDDPIATAIRTDVRRWRRDARLALHLTEPARRIGHNCPYHPDRPTELIREPNEAKLAPAVIAGTRPRSGSSISWQRSETVACPQCRRKWAGAIQLRTLMKIIDRTTLEAFVSDNVSKAINDEHLHTTLYRCPSCEGVSSNDAWDDIWYQRQRELVEAAAGQDVLDELAAHWLCPRCRSVVDIGQVEKVDGIAVVLP